MAKDYTATDLTDVKILLRIPDNNPDTGEYHSASLKITGIVKNGNFSFPIRYPESGVDFLGPGSTTMPTKAQLYNTLLNYNNLNIMLANRLRQLYIDGIDIDPSST